MRTVARDPNDILQWVRHLVLSVDGAEQAAYYLFPRGHSVRPCPLPGVCEKFRCCRLSLTLDDFLINEILQLLERRTCAVVLGDTGFIDAPTHQRSTRLLVTSMSATESFARSRPSDQPAFLCQLLERSSAFLTSLSVNGLQTRLLLVLCEIELPKLVKFKLI